jgi:hypothetical protein
VSAAPIPSLRRRPIPGMSPSPATRPDDEHSTKPEELAATATATSGPEQPTSSASPEPRPRPRPGRARSEAAAAPAAEASTGLGERRPAADYATTRLVNFRLPADLHDRYKQLVREAEQRYPRLRHPSLTELIIGLLEEGPQTAEEVAEVIRRKRAGEHEPGSTA